MWARGDCVRHGGEGFDPVLPCGGQDVGAVIARMYLATGLNIKMGRIQTLRKKQNHIPFPLLLFTTIAQKKNGVVSHPLEINRSFLVKMQFDQGIGHSIAKERFKGQVASLTS